MTSSVLIEVCIGSVASPAAERAGAGVLNLAAGLLRAAYSRQRMEQGRAICYFSTAGIVEGREFEQFAVLDENVRSLGAALAGDDRTPAHQ